MTNGLRGIDVVTGGSALVLTIATIFVCHRDQRLAVLLLFPTVALVALSIEAIWRRRGDSLMVAYVVVMIAVTLFLPVVILGSRMG